MLQNLYSFNAGGFASAIYLSSVEFWAVSNVTALGIYFLPSPGYMLAVDKYDPCNVRACRSFLSYFLIKEGMNSLPSFFELIK